MTHDEQLRAVLLDLQHSLGDRVAKLEANLDTLAAARRGNSDDDEHDPEGVTLSSEWSMLSGLLESVRIDAQQAEDALVRLDAGNYGVCTACMKPIPFEQLEVRPFRERCVPCAS